MAYQPRFTYTNDIIAMLSKIEYLRGVISSRTLPLHISRDLQLRARINSTHYSTVIEGNELSLEQVEEAVKEKEPGKSESYFKQEVRNYWRALTFLRTAKKFRYSITEDIIKRLHKIIEVRGPGRRGKMSSYRGETEPGVLFGVKDSETGHVAYIPPEYKDVPGLMADLVNWINTEKGLPVPVKAAITGYQLVTIHPFWDGNGRLTRALALYVLMLNGYDLNGYFSVEKYYARDLQRYYDGLQMGLDILYYNGRNDPDLTPWITYFLGMMAESYEEIALVTLKLHEATGGKLLELSEREIKLLELALRFKGRSLSLETMANWFDVTKRTMQEWVKDWVAIGLLEPGSGTKRITSYMVGERYRNLDIKDLELRG